MAAEPTVSYLDRIVMDPKIMLGKPTVRGTRIPVDLVLEQLSYDLDPRELFAAYPRLTEDDVKACIAYARHAVQVRPPRPKLVKTVQPSS
ncbi:MAG: DUF433 domain-containing protein [Chloroflexota bacterium]